jgi:hypothetical protein
MKTHLHQREPILRLRLRVLIARNDLNKLAALLLLLVPLASGCATVKPWQRETLADSIMQSDRNLIATAQIEHVHFSREAASGGTTVGGGGCGCN